MPINSKQIVPKACAPILREAFDNLPAPVLSNDNLNNRNWWGFQADFIDLMTEINGSGGVKWGQVCALKERLLQMQHEFFVEWKGDLVQAKINSCILKIERVLSGDPPMDLSLKKLEVGDSSEIIYASPQMQEVVDLINRLADEDGAVFLLGETGVGKELVAKALHFLSNRKEKPFKAINCAAISPFLLESELFGHQKGAFTGAHRDRAGLFSTVGEGTLFLDEIGELSSDFQPKLLRALEERKFRRVGDSDVDMEFRGRVVAATNIDIKKAVEEHKFRADLFFRLGEFFIDIPPLRKRPEDIDPLIDLFLSRLNGGNARISQKAREEIKKHNFSGNVRELRNVLQQAFVRATIHNTEHAVIEEQHLRFLL